MKIKICGLRQLADAQLAIELGATHLGVVLAPDSPRCATLAEAHAIAALARGHAAVVLVTRGLDDDSILAASQETGVSLVQPHDADSDRREQLRARGLTPIAVARVPADALALPTLAPAPTEVQPALLDGGIGGAGKSFAWQLLGTHAPHAVFIAGGITIDNVRDLLKHQPWGIDASSGVERAPGVKDPAKLRELFRLVARGAEVRA